MAKKNKSKIYLKLCYGKVKVKWFYNKRWASW